MAEEKLKKALKYVEDITMNVDEIQKRILTEILSSNAHVEYLQHHGLDGHTDRDTYKKIIPVVTYEDLKPYIDRIVNGDMSPILCSKPVSEFITSSATSGGESKLLPTTEGEIERRLSIMDLMKRALMEQLIPSSEKGKGMYLLFTRSEKKTPGGLLSSPPSTCVYRSSIFRETITNPHVNYTSPIETILCLDSHQSMYTQLLSGLCQNESVLRIGTLFAYTLIVSIKFLEKYWVRLCNDIRTGTLDVEITDSRVREAVMTTILKPNPKLATFIEEECKKESWKGIITRLWPNTKFFDTIVTGTMSQYIPALDYYSDGLPIMSTIYASSETHFGINLNPLCEPSQICYTLIPTMAYFEFLPVNNTISSGHIDSISQPEQQHLVDLADVELGQEYELVVTTYAGLYRYQVGDILRVAGFKNKAPQFNFVCRKNVILSVAYDKTSEVELQNSVMKGASHLGQFGASLTHYTSCTDTFTLPGHYVLYWEISMTEQTAIPDYVFEECCFSIEESFNEIYHHARRYTTVGPLEIKIVEKGTFDKLMEFAVNRGVSINQYKTPRCLKNVPIIELLNSKTVSSYFSPKCP